MYSHYVYRNFVWRADKQFYVNMTNFHKKSYKNVRDVYLVTSPDFLDIRYPSVSIVESNLVKTCDVTTSTMRNER